MDDSSDFNDLPWLTPERARLYAVTAALAFFGTMAGLLAALNGGFDQSGLPFGMDYASFWAASRLVWAGNGADVYVQALHKLAQLPIVPAAEYEAFYYPPPYLLLCVPLAALPFFASLAAFMGVTGLAYATALRQAVRSPFVIPAALAFAPVMLNLIAGQNAMITAAIIGTGLTLMDRRPRLAGLILGLMVIKPHLALAVPVALVLSGRWTVLVCAGLSAAALMGISTVVFGFEVWPGFLHAAETGRQTLEHGLVPFSRFQSAFAVARSLGAGIGLAYGVHALSVAAALAALVWVRVRRVAPAVERSVIVLAGLLLTPFVLDYDYVVLAFPLVWLLTAWSEQGFPAGGKRMLLVQYLLPIGLFVYAPAHVGWLGAVGFLAWLTRGIGWRHG